MGRLANILRLAKDEGIVQAARYSLRAVYERLYERKLGIDTAHCLSEAELGHVDKDRAYYSPSDYYGLRKTIKTLDIAGGREVFLDMGSGMGRVVVTAATFPFRRVIGVEVSEKLNAIAAENVRRARPRLKCADVQVVTADARDYVFPDDVTVVYFYNPFGGALLKKVFENLADSVLRSPRRVTVIYRNIAHLAEGVSRSDMLVERRRVASLYGHDYVVYDLCVLGHGDAAGRERG